jgi:hypothetical protein
VKLTTHLHLVPRLKMVVLYLHSPTRLLKPGDNFTFTELGGLWSCRCSLTVVTAVTAMRSPSIPPPARHRVSSCTGNTRSACLTSSRVLFPTQRSLQWRIGPSCHLHKLETPPVLGCTAQTYINTLPTFQNDVLSITAKSPRTDRKERH